MDKLTYGNTEVINIVSDADEVVGEMTRDEVYTKGIKHFRVINAFLINSKQELWIPTRHQTKKLFPGHLDSSVGGHVLAGETYDACLFRETREELGIELNFFPFSFIGKLTPITHNTSAFMKIFLIQYTDLEDPPFNKKDFTVGHWLTIPETLMLLDKGVKAKSDLPIMLNYLKRTL